MRQRPIEFRTVLLLTVVLGLAVALIIHFVVLSSGNYNWLAPKAATSAIALHEYAGLLLALR